MKARIYRPAKSAMQSGRAKTKEWLLEYEPAAPRRRDPLMGWTGSRDTLAQVQLSFDTRDEAIAFCERRQLAYEVQEPKTRRIKPKSYADNFRWDRPH